MKHGFSTTLLLVILLLSSWLGISGCASSRPAHASATATALEPARAPIVLVCPFDVLTTEEETVNLGLAMGPILRRDLFCVQEISLIPTYDTITVAKPFFYKVAGLKSLAATYGADIVTVGWVSRKAEKVKIEFRAFDFANDSLILKTNVEGDVSQIFKLERTLLFRLVDAMEIRLTKTERQRLAHCMPRNHEAVIDFGRGLQKELEEDRDECLEAFRRAAEADACFSLPCMSEARTFLKEREVSEALSSYKNAVERDPYSAEAWYEMNLLEAQYLDDDDRAIEYCEKALEIAPLFGKAHLSLGARLHSMDRIDRAIEETQQAVKLMPVNPLPCYNLGICYRDSGRPDEARNWFQRALKIDPGFIHASVELQKLAAR